MKEAGQAIKHIELNRKQLRWEELDLEQLNTVIQDGTKVKAVAGRDRCIGAAAERNGCEAECRHNKAIKRTNTAS